MEEILFEQIALIIVSNLALYFKSLRYKFVSDDFSVYHNPPSYKNAWHMRWLQFIGAYKHMGTSYVWKDWKFHAVKSEEQEHLLALLLHIAICVSIFFAFGANQVGFITAMLYSLNPVNNQGTIWPAGRGYALPILCITLSMAIPYLAPILLSFSAWFTVGFLAPLGLVGGGFHWIIYLSIGIAWALNCRKFYKAVKFKGDTETFDEDKVIHWRKLIILIKTYGFYLTLCIIPFRITFYHNFLQSMAGNDIMMKRAYKLDRYFLIGLIGGLGTLYLCIFHWSPLSWALLAFMITIAPFCNFIRNNQEIAERFAALPNVFLMFALAQVITSYNVLIAVFLVFYATRTYYTLDLYKDEYFITEYAMIEDPHAWWAWHCRAMKRWDNQSYREALILWVMAKLISPKEFKILMNIASALRLLKNDKEADEHLRLAEENIVKGQEKQAREFIEQHRKGKLPILL